MRIHQGTLAETATHACNAPGTKLADIWDVHAAAQIIFAVDYCHRLGIAHRDIKLENTLLDARGLIKLCDFG